MSNMTTLHTENDPRSVAKLESDIVTLKGLQRNKMQALLATQQAERSAQDHAVTAENQPAQIELASTQASEMAELLAEQTEQRAKQAAKQAAERTALAGSQARDKSLLSSKHAQSLQNLSAGLNTGRTDGKIALAAKHMTEKQRLQMTDDANTAHLKGLLRAAKAR